MLKIKDLYNVMCNRLVSHGWISQTHQDSTDASQCVTFQTYLKYNNNLQQNSNEVYYNCGEGGSHCWEEHF